MVDLLLHADPEPLEALLPSPFVIPRYDGGSVGNVPATLGAMLGVEVGTLPPLDERLWHDLIGDGIERVVLIVADAVGWERSQRALAADTRTRAWLDEIGAIVAPLTALFPSTTTATLTTLWTGTPPVQHGLLGFTLWLREVGTVANMIRLGPQAEGLHGSLKEAGLDLTTFLPVPTLAAQLAAHDVALHVLIGEGIRESGLSELHFGEETTLVGYAGLGDCLALLREQLEATVGQRCLIAAYWPVFDTLSHLRGPDLVQWDAEWELLFHGLREILLSALPAPARRRTAVVILADHGHNPIRQEGKIYLKDHPELADCLLIPPTGDARAPYLHVLPGRLRAAREYVETRLGHAFHVVEGERALHAGLWGPGEPMGEVPARIGDLVLLARDGYVLLPEPREREFMGMHGSLLPDEAMVPWIAWRLDA